jgi:hypothetical protein
MAKTIDVRTKTGEVLKAWCSECGDELVVDRSRCKTESDVHKLYGWRYYVRAAVFDADAGSDSGAPAWLCAKHFVH